MTVKLLMLVIFFAIMLGVGFYSRRHATNVNDFVLGGRGVGPWLTAFAYGTSYFSAVVFIGYAGQFGWKYGLASTWIGIGNALIGSLLRKIEFKEEWNMGSILSGPLEEELERHNREMQRARNYIRSKRKKTEFELCVIGSYQMFYDQALEAVQGIRELWPGADELPSEGTAQNNTGKYLKLGPYQEDQDALEAAEVQPPFLLPFLPP